MEQLTIAYKYALRKYDFVKHMSISFAEKIVQQSINKIQLQKNLSFEEQIANEIQMMNGMMAWSKFVPITSKPQRFRYYTTNSIIERVRQFPEVINNKKLINNLHTITTSGAEKQAKLTYLVKDFMRNNEDLERKILRKSERLFDKYLR